MRDTCRKFTGLARKRFEEALEKLHSDVSSVQGSLMGLRSNIRSFCERDSNVITGHGFFFVLTFF